MWLSVLTLLLAGDPGPNTPEALFKRMEEPILKCKTFKADVEIAVGPDKDLLKGRLLVAQGNKMLLELEGTIKGKPAKMGMVSDGTTMRSTGDVGLGKDQDTPKQLSETGLASLARSGIFVPMFLVLKAKQPGEKPVPFDLDKEFAISDFKLGKKETISGKETQAIEYKLTVKSGPGPLSAIVWIDTKTNLPVKRIVTVQAGKETVTLTETYTKTALDKKIDGKEFKLPK